MNLTEEQHTVCQAARDLGVRSSLKIQAFAGTGKTTTLTAIAESLPQRKFHYLVFNRAAADEAERVIVKSCGSAGHDQAASLGWFSVD